MNLLERHVRHLTVVALEEIGISNAKQLLRVVCDEPHRASKTGIADSDTYQDVDQQELSFTEENMCRVIGSSPLDLFYYPNTYPNKNKNVTVKTKDTPHQSHNNTIGIAAHTGNPPMVSAGTHNEHNEKTTTANLGHKRVGSVPRGIPPLKRKRPSSRPDGCIARPLKTINFDNCSPHLDPGFLSCGVTASCQKNFLTKTDAWNSLGGLLLYDESERAWVSPPHMPHTLTKMSNRMTTNMAHLANSTDVVNLTDMADMADVAGEVLDLVVFFYTPGCTSHSLTFHLLFCFNLSHLLSLSCTHAHTLYTYTCKYKCKCECKFACT